MSSVQQEIGEHLAQGTGIDGEVFARKTPSTLRKGSQFYLAPRSRLQGALAIMRPVYTFSVIPSLPCAIEGLREVAFNLRWSWSHESVELFRWLDQESTDLPSI